MTDIETEKNTALCGACGIAAVTLEEVELASALHGDEDALAIERGDRVAWCIRYGSRWSVVAIAPDDGRRTIERTAFFNSRWPSEWVTRVRAAKPVKTWALDDDTGGWIAAKRPDGSFVLALCVQAVDGKPARIKLSDTSEIIPVEQVPLSWFQIVDRDTGCARLFFAGKNDFVNYLNFVQRLGRAQKDAKAGRGVKRPIRKG